MYLIYLNFLSFYLVSLNFLYFYLNELLPPAEGGGMAAALAPCCLKEISFPVHRFPRTDTARFRCTGVSTMARTRGNTMANTAQYKSNYNGQNNSKYSGRYNGQHNSTGASTMASTLANTMANTRANTMARTIASTMAGTMASTMAGTMASAMANTTHSPEGHSARDISQTQHLKWSVCTDWSVVSGSHEETRTRAGYSL